MPSDMSVPSTSFRSADLNAGSADLAFLCRLYASTRQEELAQTGWPQAQIDSFLQQQFEAQHVHYMKHFAKAKFDLILNTRGQPIGRLYLDERQDEIRIIDIALLPANRGNGIGGRILEDILAQAQKSHKPVRIHVEKNNPAMRLYRRLGFFPVEDQGVYELLERSPQPILATS